MAKFNTGIREEQLKNELAKEYFKEFDATKIIGNIDFTVALHPIDGEEGSTLFPTDENLVWAEAKSGVKHNIYHSLVQLILTIGRARTFDQNIPPKYLAAFDCEKIAFLEYSEVQVVFFLNDFNWNVTPSDHTTKEFGLLLNLVSELLDNQLLLFDYEKQDKELRLFIKENLKADSQRTTRIQVNKNNFTHIYNRWRECVMPVIDIDWEKARKAGIIAADFYLADLLSEGNKTIIETLFVLLQEDTYILDRNIDQYGLLSSRKAAFKKGGKAAHCQFWNHYERPPRKEYWEYLITRRDLLVPQDIRERKGSFFTPRSWVILSQEYLANTLGEDWQEKYYIWDCCAGTGNLLEGLTNKYNIFASTLDKQDVDVMHERINKMNKEAERGGVGGNASGANLLKEHVFQFDFLNDDLQSDKVPEGLRRILADPKERQKLVIYINPPYAETASDRTQDKKKENKRGVSFTKTREKYADLIGIGTKELYAQFLIRIYMEVSGCVIGEFSKLKALMGSNFKLFRNAFKATFLGGFIVPADTFDNVKGDFPIGFKIWNTYEKRSSDRFQLDVYDRNGTYLVGKSISAPERTITDFFRPYHDRLLDEHTIGAIGLYGADFQHSKYIAIYNAEASPNRWTYIKRVNLIYSAIYLALRHCIEATWINDRDQFLYPNDGWENLEFQSDCLAYTLFHGQNRITSELGTNHWIPFTEEEVQPRGRFESHFMHQFISGKLEAESGGVTQQGLFDYTSDAGLIYDGTQPIQFSPEAELLFEAGRKLWRYYHSQEGSNPNASYYDIRLHFQGRSDKGRMNNDSEDAKYMELVTNLRQALAYLGTHKIAPKAYDYGFLIK